MYNSYPNTSTFKKISYLCQCLAQAALTRANETTFWENKRKRLSDITHDWNLDNLLVILYVIDNQIFINDNFFRFLNIVLGGSNGSSSNL